MTLTPEEVREVNAVLFEKLQTGLFEQNAIDAVNQYTLNLMKVRHIPLRYALFPPPPGGEPLRGYLVRVMQRELDRLGELRISGDGTPTCLAELGYTSADQV